MGFQTVFKRYELKYLITKEQAGTVMLEMAPFMLPDSYGETEIRNIYFDTPSYRLIRRSLEKPVYKEKLRVRSYGRAREDSTVFVEIKKKYKHVVYKRRVAMTEKEALMWLTEGITPEKETQITREIDYFREFYSPLKPSAYLSYDRSAFYSVPDSSFRVTFDRNIRFSSLSLTLQGEAHGGILLLPENTVLMELKCGGAIPLWMASILSREKIYRTSFSKYGTAYTKFILPELRVTSVIRTRPKA